MAKHNNAKPSMVELSKADHGILMAKALIQCMVENPDNILLGRGGGQLNIYKDLLRDDQVKSCFQQRRSAVVYSEYYVEAASDSKDDQAAAEWWRSELQRISFDRITDMMLYATHYGWSVAETLYAVMDDGKIHIDEIKVRDRARFGFSGEGELYLKQTLGPHKHMPKDNFWTLSVGADHSDNPYGEGLAHSLYWPVFFKRNGIKFWLIFLEKFGMPTAMAKLNQAQVNDPEQRKMALSIIDAIQADSGVVVPDDFVVELLEASRSGTADYQALHSSMDKAISKIILSQTMTTDDGSSKSQSEVHRGVRDQVVKSDADLLCESFNQQVVTRMTEWNFPKATPPKVWRQTAPDSNATQLSLIERDTKMAELGYEPTEDYIRETYGDGWQKKVEPQTDAPSTSEDDAPSTPASASTPVVAPKQAS